MSDLQPPSPQPSPPGEGGERRKRAGRSDARATVDRLPPNAAEAEKGVLSCVLQNPAECLDDAREVITDERAFYDLRHQCIWHSLLTMQEKGEAINLITVKQRLLDAGLLEQLGGVVYLMEVEGASPSPSQLPSYLGLVREKYWLRRWIALCTEIVGEVYECERDVEGLVGRISTEVFKLCENATKSTEQTLREVMLQVHEQYLEKFRRGVKHKIGPMTGFNYLDNILPGLGRGQLIVIAARPRTGKSAMMMQVAEYVAAHEATPCAVFSLEMTAVSLGARALFQRAGSDITKFLNGFMSEADVQKLVMATEELAKLEVHIDESARMSIEDLEIRCRRMVRRHKLGVIFVDYFQLLYVRNRQRQWSKSDELAEVSMRLKALAKELNVAVVLCAQMNREIEKETHRRPRLSDLRDTGQLEQDADVVMFLWKPDVSSEAWEKRVADILPRMPVPEDWRMVKTWKKQLAIVTCTVEKQREGRSGEDATLVFIKPWTRFVDAYKTVAQVAEEPLALRDRLETDAD
jgi:replicative DNA helicase